MRELSAVPYDLRRAAPLHCGALPHMRSAVIMVDTVGGSGFNPAPDRCIDWIERYSAWFLDRAGISSGRAAHLLYDREIALIGDRLLSCRKEIGRLGRRLKQLGFALSVTLDAAELLEQHEQLAQLLSSELVTSLGVVIPQTTPDSAGPPLLAALAQILDANVNLGLIVDSASCRRLGIYKSSRLSAANVNFSSNEGGLVAHFSATPVRQCYSRLRLYVDPAGDIFPCLGLVGIGEASLGNIDDPLEATGLDDAQVMDLLDHWHRHGPDVVIPIHAQRRAYPELPAMCELHRGALGA